MSGKGEALHVIAKALEGAGVRDAEKVAAHEAAHEAENVAARSGTSAAEHAAEQAASHEVGGHTIADLEKAAAAEDRNGLVRAGRAAQKHGDRPGSVFPKTGGTAQARNEAGKQIVNDILHDPNRREEVLDNVINIWDSSGRGLRYSRDGRFMGFLEPVK